MNILFHFKVLTVPACDHVIQHEQLVHVEQDPGEVAGHEHEDDAEEDGGEVELGGALLVVLPRPGVGHPDAAENRPVEEDERSHGHDAWTEEIQLGIVVHTLSLPNSNIPCKNFLSENTQGRAGFRITWTSILDIC